MGQSKAWLPYGSEFGLQRIVRLIREEIQDIVVVAARDQALPILSSSIPIVRDELVGQGPLRGLQTGLKAVGARSQFVFLASCDIPLLQPKLIPLMYSVIGHYDAVLPQVGGQDHPLTAIYKTNVYEKIDKLLLEGDLRMASLVATCLKLSIGETEIKSIDRDFLSFHNVNTPEDYHLALTLIGR
jgi:molybdopterin-guanine dinucleotide biosynthesis protein A